MLVTRSNPNLPKHKGMTYFAVDMHSSGVEVRPLRQITGEAEFNEVYLTDARIPDANRIGAEGEGWRVALTTLMNERTAIGGGSANTVKPRRGGAAQDAMAVWNCLPESERTSVRRDQLLQLWVRGEVGRLTNLRAAEKMRTGNPGPEGSVSKLEFAEFNKSLYSFCIDLMGADGQIGYDCTFRRPTELDATGAVRGMQHAFLRVRANSIEGARRRSFATSWASRYSGSRASPESTRSDPGPTCRAVEPRLKFTDPDLSMVTSGVTIGVWVSPLRRWNP